MAISLEPGRRALENLMDDACTVTRDPSGTADDTFDQTTGAYTPPAGDVTEVYSGKCLLSFQTGVGREGNRGGGSFQTTGYKLQIPVSAPPLQVGDWVELTGSLRDSQQVGRRFQVESTQYRTLTLTRSANLVAEEEVEL